MPKLNRRNIEALPVPSKNKIVFDEAVKGFGLRLSPTGRKTFIVQYRAKGRTRRVKIGLYGVLTADEARNLARQILGDVAKGNNPAEDIYNYRRAPTMHAACDRFLEEHVDIRLKPSTQSEYRRSIEIFIRPAFGPRKVEDIMRADISQLHYSMRDKPYQANRTLGVLSKLFNMIEIWGLRPDGSNPCRHVPKYPEKKRERYLTPVELVGLGQVLDQLEFQGSESLAAIYAIRLLILTGCRLREIQTLKWEYLDAHYINLPDSKTGKRKIPLSPALSGLLSRLVPVEDNPYVIVGKEPGKHLTDLQRPWRRIRAKANLDDVRIHDLRHTYASNAISSGLSLEVVGKLLGHTQYQTTMRYAHLYDGPIKDAASLVGNNLGGLISSGISLPAIQIKPHHGSKSERTDVVWTDQPQT